MTTESAKHAAMARIVESIQMTNNGKLMTARISNRYDREMVPSLVAEGLLSYATFLNPRDAVRLPGTGSAIEPGYRQPSHCSFSAYLRGDGPDYEGMILARQEAAGYYD